jgi:hypothetical protein
MDLHLQAHRVAEFVALDAECDVPRRARQFDFRAVEINRGGASSLLTQVEKQVLFLENARLGNGFHAAGEEERLGVGAAGCCRCRKVASCRGARGNPW